MGSSPSVTLAFASSLPSCIARPPPCRTRMPGDAMHLVEQRARDPLHLAGGERAVVEQVSARRVAPFAIGRQDCREPVVLGIVVIEAGRIGIGERFGYPQTVIAPAPTNGEAEIKKGASQATLGT